MTQKDLDMIESLYEDERRDVGSPPGPQFDAEMLRLLSGSF